MKLNVEGYISVSTSVILRSASSDQLMTGRPVESSRAGLGRGLFGSGLLTFGRGLPYLAVVAGDCSGVFRRRGADQVLVAGGHEVQSRSGRPLR